MTAPFDPARFFWLELDRTGALSDATPLTPVAQALAAGATDLVILSHGWNNDRADAERLYAALWANVRGRLHVVDPVKLVVCGIVWPAQSFRTDFDQGLVSAPVAAAFGDAAFTDLHEDAFAQIVAQTAGFLSDPALDPLVRAAAASPSDGAAPLFARLKALTTPAAGDTELAEQSRVFDPSFPFDTLSALQQPPDLTVSAGVGGALSIADGLHGIISGARAAAARLLNVATYFEMKNRAGIVGTALGHALAGLDRTAGVRLHLVGHSFGARLVTAAADAYRQMPGEFELRSLTLLQGAFSHNALSLAQHGVFSGVIDHVSGPISVTHTHNDWATGIAYAVASRLSRDTTRAVGDPDDRFGAMGGNGALHVAPAHCAAASAVRTGFAPVAGKVNNFLADAYVVAVPGVVDAHNNVTGSECGALVAATIEA